MRKHIVNVGHRRHVGDGESGCRLVRPVDGLFVDVRQKRSLHSGCGKPVTAQCGRHDTGSGWGHWLDVHRHQRGYEPFAYDGRFWIRRGRATVTPSPSELQELMNAFGFVLTEQQGVSSATVDDIDFGAVRTFMQAQGLKTDLAPQPTREADLCNASIVEELDGVLRLTLYGLMMFGRDPQAFPQTGSQFVQCAAYAGADQASDVLSAGEGKGRLEDQVHRAMGWFPQPGPTRGLSRALSPGRSTAAGGRAARSPRQRGHPSGLRRHRIPSPAGGVRRPVSW